MACVVAVDSKGHIDVTMMVKQHDLELSLIKPETWYNIPDPVAHSIGVITKDMRVIFEQIQDLGN